MAPTPVGCAASPNAPLLSKLAADPKQLGASAVGGSLGRAGFAMAMGFVAVANEPGGAHLATAAGLPASGGAHRATATGFPASGGAHRATATGFAASGGAHRATATGLPAFGGARLATATGLPASGGGRRALAGRASSAASGAVPGGSWLDGTKASPRGSEAAEGAPKDSDAAQLVAVGTAACTASSTLL